MGILYSSDSRVPIWPDDKQFAFTIFDDTDLATMQNIPAIYQLLNDLGFRTTKSVWPLEGTIAHPTRGVTCQDADYVRWLLQLQGAGFEIGYHMATWHTSTGEVTKRAIARFEELFGAPPRTMANHSSCGENIYWGATRLTGMRKLIYNAMTFGRYRSRFRGHVSGDPLFWGDLCQEKISYVRGFVLPGINTLRACPFMPYHDQLRPFVNCWFASSEGKEVESFNNLLSERNQDRLEAERGACIVYTHFGAGFVNRGTLNDRFKTLMARLSKKNGWFIPVATLLDYLKGQRSNCGITNSQRVWLERNWLWYKFIKGRV